MRCVFASAQPPGADTRICTGRVVQTHSSGLQQGIAHYSMLECTISPGQAVGGRAQVCQLPRRRHPMPAWGITDSDLAVVIGPLNMASVHAWAGESAPALATGPATAALSAPQCAAAHADPPWQPEMATEPWLLQSPYTCPTWSATQLWLSPGVESTAAPPTRSQQMKQDATLAVRQSLKGLGAHDALKTNQTL